MLKVGDRVERVSTSRQGTVRVLGPHEFRVEWDHREGKDLISHAYNTLFPIEGGEAIIQLVRPPVTPYPAQAVRNADANLSYAKAVGSMESRLAMVYSTIVRAITLNDGEHTASVAWNLNWIRERVEFTADYVASIATPNGVPSFTYLRDEIARQRSNFTTDTPEEN